MTKHEKAAWDDDLAGAADDRREAERFEPLGQEHDPAFMRKFWSRVGKTDSCWVWNASRTSAGYGNLRINGGNDYAHRVSYRLAKGAIPAGLHLDHLCRNRACVNPGHLEAVTPAVNVARGAGPYGAVRSTCKHGHDIRDDKNVYTGPNGNHRCKVCARLLQALRTEERRERGDLRKVLKKSCLRGHPLEGANLYVAPSGQRRCRKCSALRARSYRTEKK